MEDGLGAVILYRYDVRGNRIYEEKAINEKVRQVIHFVYNKAGRLTEQREELDSGLEPAAGEHRTAVTTYGYDENGNRILTQTPEGYRITREYDALDRLVMERVEDRQNGIDRSVKVNYDKAGNITGIVRQGKNGQPWEISYDYDLKDRVTHANDCLGPVFRYEYDKNDRLLKEALSGTELDRFHAYSYDFRGNLVAEEDSTGTLQEKHSYRADGKLAESWFADGNELIYSYGVNGLEKEIRTSRSRQANRAAQEYTYDSRGRIPTTMPGMSPAPRTPTAASSPTGITARGRSVRSSTRKGTARPSAMTGKGAWCSMQTGMGTRCVPPTTWTGTRCWNASAIIWEKVK